MACHAMLNTRQPAMPAPGRPGRVRRDAAGGTVSAASGTVSAASGTVSSDVPGASAVLSVPWWGVVSAAVAPVLLISGWTFAAGVQRGTYNAVADTVSALAGEGAADRWVMTLAFLAAGVFEVVTGLSLRPAAAAGRLILMAGGGRHAWTSRPKVRRLGEFRSCRTAPCRDHATYGLERFP